MANRPERFHPNPNGGEMRNRAALAIWATALLALVLSIVALVLTESSSGNRQENTTAASVQHDDNEKPTATSTTAPTAGVNATEQGKTAIQAINALRQHPDTSIATTPEARQFAQILKDHGFYYVTTYVNGTRRINYQTGSEPKIGPDIEFTINPQGMLIDVAAGPADISWAVFCNAPAHTPTTLESLIALNNVAINAQTSFGFADANSGCSYQQFNHSVQQP